MKIVTGHVMQQIDKRAIEEFHVPSLSLMENAGKGCADIILKRFPTLRKAAVVAGKGNNGGDGYVIARHLQSAGWDVTTYVLATAEEVSGDAAANLRRLEPGRVVFCPGTDILRQHAEEIHDADAVIDAIFGTGLKKALSGLYAYAVEVINDSHATVVAVDIPSGIDAASGRILGTAVSADLTVTFAVAKCGHLLSPGAEHTGDLHVVDIGIPSGVIEDADTFDYIDCSFARGKLRPRKRTSHKGTFGHAFIVAGSIGKSGAAAMAANSCVRGGAGLTTVAVPRSINAIMEVKTTEAMTVPLPDSGEEGLVPASFDTIRKTAEGKTAMAVGPGIGTSPGTVMLVHQILAQIPLPMVIDADGLNAVAQDASILLRKASPAIILTPHPGEMSRLCGMTVGAVEEDRIAAARGFATRSQVFVILKGAGTVIASPDGRVSINGSGNPGMASGGMGDVLTGIITALLAQGYPPYDAAVLGVFLHGHSADMVAREKGEIGLTAVDVQECLPYAFKEIMGMPGLPAKGGI